MRRLTMPLKQRRTTPHRLVAKATKAFLLVLCLAVLPVGCSSISRYQNFPEPPQVFGGTRMNIIYPDGMYMRPLGIAGDFGAFGGSSNDKDTRKWTLKVFENDRLVFTSEQLGRRISE